MNEDPTFRAIWDKWMAEDGNPGGLCKYEDDFRAMFDDTIKVMRARTCDACKHWDGAGDDGLPYGACMNPMLADNDARADVAEADDFGMDGYLSTGPKFGCVHWEAKP